MRERTAAEREIEEQRQRRIRADAKRSMGVNLAEGIALSRWLMSFRGSACR